MVIEDLSIFTQISCCGVHISCFVPQDFFYNQRAENRISPSTLTDSSACIVTRGTNVHNVHACDSFMGDNKCNWCKSVVPYGADYTNEALRRLPGFL